MLRYSLYLLSTLFLTISSFSAPPPPPPLRESERDLHESQWNPTRNVELINSYNVLLNRNRYLNGIKFSRADKRSIIDLAGHTLVLGQLGIISNSPINGSIGNGVLTSSVGNIDISFHTNSPDNLFTISATITDYGNTRVGLNFKRNDPGNDHRGATLSGSESNTFTGDVNLIGRVNLNLEKTNGAISVQKNINIIDGSHLRILISEQIANSSRVSLISKGKNPSSGIYFVYVDGISTSTVIRETIHELFVDGRGHVDFSRAKSPSPQQITSFLLLDDLIMTDGSLLTIDNWTEGKAHLLVRKSSAHFEDSLKKIRFTGYKTVHTRDYDADYWEIYAELPEPGSYGAGLLLVGIGTMALRNRLRARSPTR